MKPSKKEITSTTSRQRRVPGFPAGRINTSLGFLSINLDGILAIFGASISGLAAILLFFSTNGGANSILLGYVAVACIVYLSVRKHILTTFARIQNPLNNKAIPFFLAYGSIFAALLIAAVVIFARRPETYARPFFFFVLVSLSAGVVAIEITEAPRGKASDAVIIVQIIALGLVLRLTPQIMFPGHIWFDPWYHDYFTAQIIETSHIPEMGFQSYSKLPSMHLIMSGLMLTVGLSFEDTFAYVLTPFQVVGLILFTYLLADRYFYQPRLGLLAALLLSISDVIVSNAYVAYPMGLGGLFLIAILYVLSRAKEENSFPMLLILFTLMGLLILTHSLSSLVMVIVLLCYWIADLVTDHILRREKSRVRVGIVPALLFSVSMLSWWMYASGHILSVAKAVRWGLSSEFFHLPTPEHAMFYASQIPTVEILLDRLGFSLIYAFSVIGCLYLISTKSKAGSVGVAIAVGGSALTIISFVGQIANAYILATRWYFFSHLMLAIPASIGILILGTIARRRMSLILGITLAILAFFMVTSTAANFDTPIFSPSRTVRRAFTLSELKSMDTIAHQWQGLIVSDQHVNAYLQFARGAEVEEINEELDSRDFRQVENALVLIRDYVTQEPFYARSVWRLDYDPEQILWSQGFSKVYDSQSVSAFHRWGTANLSDGK